jgi:hypothetical protein
MGAAALTKAARRNLVHTLGETAADAVEKCRQLAAATHMQQQALAREVATLRETVDNREHALTSRINAMGSWCQQLEEHAAGSYRLVTERLEVIESTLVAVEAGAKEQREQLEAFEDLTCLQRLRWLIFGTLPWGDEPDDVPTACCDASDATMIDTAPISSSGEWK